jgi:hypothetical protein
MKLLYSILIFLTLSGFSNAQLAPGKWEYHLSLSKTTEVIEVGDKIYFLSEGGIYYFNKKDNSIETLNKTDKLSGADFMGISYNSQLKCLVITYKNSTIDLVWEDGSVFPILDIKRKNISGDKLIYNAFQHENLCYLACGFGIVVLDIAKREIKDSYIIGKNGNLLPVFDVALDKEYIYAATKEGLKYAPNTGVNLLDFSVWKTIENNYIKPVNFEILEIGWNRLWAVHKSELWNGDRVYTRHTENLWYYEFLEYGAVSNIKITNNKLIYCNKNSVVVIEDGNTKSLIIDKYKIDNNEMAIKPRSALIDRDGILWIADENYGGIRYENGKFTRISPSGPFNNSVFGLTFSDNTLWTSAGGYNNSWGGVFYDFNVGIYTNGKWESVNKHNKKVDNIYRDAIQVVPFPGNPNRYYVTTAGYGLLEFNNGEMVNNFSEKNSSLLNIYPGDYYVRIGGADFDSEGNLWLTNSLVEKNLHQLKSDGTWKAFTLPEISFNYDVGQLLVTQNNDIWIIVPRNKTNGLYVMSNDGSKKKHLNVTSFFTNGKDSQTTPMNDVYSIAEDKEGAIWVGTSNGVTTYNNPENVFDENPFYAYQPGIDLNDGFYHPLLENITVTAIAVDGGNRKWCGTKSNGLFLISPNGQKEILHFTTDNSPLISNTITSLAYDGVSGILYIGTQDGLVAYRTDSKEPENQFAKVYAYPNPVRENYKGNIYITGLVSNTNVKITTTSGRLVYETTSVGGQAVWDGNDLAGNRVHTGVYLAFCANPDGSQSAVTKILFIR